MKSQTFIALALITAWIPFNPVFSYGQEKTDGPVGIFQSQQEYNQFMGSVKRTAYGPNGNAELQAMVPLLNDIALNQPMGSTAKRYNTDQRSTLDLLSDSNIRKELEMVDSQYNELKKLNDAIQDRLAQQVRSLDFNDPAGLAERIRNMRDDAQRDLDSLFLPHQLERLKQIVMQSQLRRRSLVDIITSDPMKSELEITDDQTEDLKQAEKEIEKELAEQIAKLREKARGKLLSRLKPSQAAAVKEQIGDAYDFQDSSKQKPDPRSKNRLKKTPRPTS